MNQIVRSVLVEVPAEITGRRRLNYRAATAIYDQGHGWVQLQRAGGPNGTTLWNFPAGPAGAGQGGLPVLSKVGDWRGGSGSVSSPRPY